MTSDSKTTRRRFLTGASQSVVAGIAIGELGGVAQAQAQTEPAGAVRWTNELPKKWDESYDVVIIGSGFAGLAAALEAKKAGATVAILEKMRVAGGNSIINGGGVSCAGSPLQAQKGIKDSPEQMLKDMLAAGLGLNHPELVRMVAEESWPTVKWTIDELGVKYTDFLVPFGGHAVPRGYQTANGSGSAIVMPMLAKLKAMGQNIKLQTYVERVLRDRDGRVKGVKVRERYVFPRADSGTVRFIQAKRAVIMTHGGFEQDVGFRTTQDPRLSNKMQSTSQPGATSEMLRESLRVGGIPVQLSWIQVGPWGSADEQGFGNGPHFAEEVAAPYGIWINAATGKRFISELASRKTRADAITAIMNGGQRCVAIADAGNIHGNVTTLIQPMLESGVLKKFDNFDEIASAYNIPADTLKKTVTDFNGYLTEGKDPEFARRLEKDTKPLGSTKPIYVMRLLPKVHYCMGGVSIDTGAHVTDVLTDKPIPGLYLAGEATGGIHGADRLGGCSAIDCLVFGRIAGRNAAAEKPWA